MDSSADKITVYRPLIVITAIALLGAVALSGHVPFMNGLMGLFLCFLAALQLFDLSGFAETFARYDLLAARFSLYGRAYPIIELALGLLYLSGLWPLFTNLFTLAVMVVGTAGVAKALQSGVKIRCACAGTAFSLPVGKVTVFENLVMAVMAAANIIHL